MPRWSTSARPSHVPSHTPLCYTLCSAASSSWRGALWPSVSSTASHRPSSIGNRSWTSSPATSQWVHRYASSWCMSSADRMSYYAEQQFAADWWSMCSFRTFPALWMTSTTSTNRSSCWRWSAWLTVLSSAKGKNHWLSSSTRMKAISLSSKKFVPSATTKSTALPSMHAGDTIRIPSISPTFGATQNHTPLAHYLKKLSMSSLSLCRDPCPKTEKPKHLLFLPITQNSAKQCGEKHCRCFHEALELSWTLLSSASAAAK